MKRSDRAIGQCLSRLIRIPSVNPYSGDIKPAGEAEIQEALADLFRRAGCRISYVSVPGDVYRRAGVLGPKDRSWAGRRNMVARLRFGRGGPVVVLNAHCDTVGADDYHGDPFSGRRDGDRVFGRGASDCRSGLVAGLFAISALAQSGAELNGEIVFESVVDEECNGAGAGTLACCLAGIRGDYAIELDGPAGLVYSGCSGVLTAGISVIGSSGHGSYGGVSAVDKILVAKEAVDRLKSERRRQARNYPVNVGVLSAGTAPWTNPEHGLLLANINYSHAEAQGASHAGKRYCGAIVRERLEKFLGNVCRSDEWLRRNPARLEWIKDVPPYELDGTDASTRLVETAVSGFRTAWDTMPATGTFFAWCDASHLAGTGRMPTVGIGAGERMVSHASVEWARISKIRRSAAAVALTTLNLLHREAR